MPRIICLLLVSLLISATGAAQEDIRSLKIGDPAPPLACDEWLAGDAPADLCEPGRITVVEFWATWCPISRLVMSRQDSLAALPAYRDVQFVVLSQENASTQQRFLGRAGWRNLHVGCDESRASLAGWFDRAAGDDLRLKSRIFPFAFIVAEDSGVGDDPARGPGTILWLGPVNDVRAEDTLGAFETALADIISRRYDLAAALELDRQEQSSVALYTELYEARDADDLERMEAALGKLKNTKQVRSHANTVSRNMNGIAWRLATREDATARHLAAAETAIEMALAAGGDENPGMPSMPVMIDTQARVYYEQGRLEEAIATQTRAVDLLRGQGEYDTYLAVLNGYREAAGLAPLASEIQPDEVREIWSDNLNAAFETGAEGLLVRPRVPADTTLAAGWDANMASIIKSFYQDVPFCLPHEVTEAELAERMVTLYGTPAGNSITEHVLAHYDMELSAEGLRVGEDFVALENPVLITCLPSPWNPALPIRLYTAFSEDRAQNLNRFFHGPTSLMIGQWRDGSPNPVYQLDWCLENSADGRVRVFLSLPPTALSAAEACEDLLALHDELAATYAGYEDIAWDLRVAGSSWTEREADYLRRIEKRGTWTWGAFFDLLTDYLAPVSDTHFSMQGLDMGGGGQRRARLIRSHVVWFSDLSIRRDGERFLVANAPPGFAHFIGAELKDLPIIDSPHTLEPGRAYLFPTLPMATCPTEATRFLLGLIAPRGDAPSSLEQSLFMSDERRKRPVRHHVNLPLHRGRAFLDSVDRSTGHWTLNKVGPDSLPVLAVRSMNPSRLRDLPATADTLRSEETVILDLRRNYGGGDGPAMLWCPRFSGQPFEWVGYIAMWQDDDPLHHYSSMPGSRMGTRNNPVAPMPYDGRLYVLTDAGVASSGETFTHLAGQVNGALLIGENTAGCVSYGNVNEHPPLPHSRIKLYYGRSRFVVDWVRPIREGIGFFPDYWVDEDPIGLIGSKSR